MIQPDYAKPSMVYHINANSPVDAISSLPKVGDLHPECGLRIVQYDIASVPRSFFDWLFQRPPLWEVKVTFEKSI